jgi:NADH-quinone oxidoreductase subunit H
MHLVGAEPKQSLQGFYVLIVLMEWVLELVVGSENLLGPVTLMRAAENPTFHILGFYNENTKLRNQNMVDLCGAVFRGEGGVLDQMVAGFIQDRLGPMEVGYRGLLQTVADLLKLLQKEEIVPTAAHRLTFKMAPVIIFVAVFLGFATIPMAPGLQGADTPVGLYFLISIISLDIIGFLLAGWSSNNKYSLLGAMRAVSQIISYEVPLGLMILAVVMIAQSMDMQVISMQQGIFYEGTNYLFGIKALGIDTSEIGGFINWNIIRFPLLIPGLLIFFIVTLAESNRAPFDIPEAESELIAGFQTEYSGFRWSMIMLGEYAMMLLMGFLGSVLFLGSWNTPLPNMGSLELANWTSGVPGQLSGYLWGSFWLASKALFWVFVQLWVRWTYPRLRVDQLMFLCWKVLTPASLLTVLIAGIWRILMVIG